MGDAFHQSRGLALCRFEILLAQGSLLCNGWRLDAYRRVTDFQPNSFSIHSLHKLPTSVYFSHKFASTRILLCPLATFFQSSSNLLYLFCNLNVWTFCTKSAYAFRNVMVVRDGIYKLSTWALFPTHLYSIALFFSYYISRI